MSKVQTRSREPILPGFWRGGGAEESFPALPHKIQAEAETHF